MEADKFCDFRGRHILRNHGKICLEGTEYFRSASPLFSFSGRIDHADMILDTYLSNQFLKASNNANHQFYCPY